MIVQSESDWVIYRLWKKRSCLAMEKDYPVADGLCFWEQSQDWRYVHGQKDAEAGEGS